MPLTFSNRDSPDRSEPVVAGNPARRPAFQLVEPPEKAAAATIGRPTKKKYAVLGRLRLHVRCFNGAAQRSR